MTVYEPATLLTDGMLGALAAWLGWRLFRRPGAAHPATRWWSRMLAMTAAAACIGGAYHGFAPNFPVTVGQAWWLATLWNINLLSAAMALSLLCELVPAHHQRLWQVLIGGKLAVFTGAVVLHPDFVVVIMDYGLTMLAWTAAALLLHRPWRGWMLAAIALSVVAAVAQQMPWDPAPTFNHNDLYHVIQALALFLFYRAGTVFAGPAH
jgi:hypothetical protein